MRRPRNLLCAEIAETLTGKLRIFINAHAIGGSVVLVSPKDARRIGQRLIEMADWMESQTNAKNIISN